MKSIYSKFRVRVLFSYPLAGETIIENLTWPEAVEKFKYFVCMCLEFPELSVRCVNIFKGSRCVKMFENH